jgi:hypothetical protein
VTGRGGNSADYADLIRPADLAEAGPFLVTAVHRATTRFGDRIVLDVTLLQTTSRYASGEQYACMLSDQPWRRDLLSLFSGGDEPVGPCVLVRGEKGQHPWLLNDAPAEGAF